MDGLAPNLCRSSKWHKEEWLCKRWAGVEQWRTRGLIPVGTSELMTAELVIMQQSLNGVIQLVTSNTKRSVCRLSVRLNVYKLQPPRSVSPGSVMRWPSPNSTGPSQMIQTRCLHTGRFRDWLRLLIKPSETKWNVRIFYSPMQFHTFDSCRTLESMSALL